MAQTVEAVLEPSGEIRLLEPLTVSKSTRLLVTVVPERPLGTLYDEAISSVTTEELERTARETGGRSWSEIRQRLVAE